jgi:phospholipid/cholesterol/gamma-HCH transport system substrate-binding protein
MKKTLFETLFGAFILLSAIGFAYYLGSQAGFGKARNFQLTAEFDRADGIMVGSDVLVSGVKVGKVTDKQLDPHTYMANVKMSFDKSYQFPVDTTAQIASDGLLGGSHLKIVPGSDEEEFIEPGGRIEFTSASMGLMDLLGKFIFSMQGSK